MELKKNNIHGSLLMYGNPHYYQYFTIEVLTEGSFTISTPQPESPTVYYSLNKNSWTQWEYNGTGLLKTLNLNTGDKLRIKSVLSDPIESGDGYKFSSSDDTEYNVSGNIMSLVYGDDFVGNDNFNDTMTSSEFKPFEYMFQNNTNIRSAINLCLPSFILSSYMYASMFESSSLETAPTIIPAKICEGCYHHMFYDCKQLTGNIVIPEPIGVDSNTPYDAYSGMFEDSPNINVDCLVLMNKEVTPDILNSIGISKGRFVLPWDGLTYGDGDKKFKAELKRFEDQSLTISDTETEITKMFKFSPDKFGETLSLTNEYTLLRQLYGTDYDPEEEGTPTISLIEPLKYFKEQPLTFEAIDNCEFIWESIGPTDSEVQVAAHLFYKNPNNLKYSINGSPWINYTGGVIVPKGSKISWRNSTSISIDKTNPNASIYTYFKINTNGDGIDKNGKSCGRFNVSGNIMSLFSDSFEDLDTIKGCIGNLLASDDEDGSYYPGIFNGCHIISARNLVLPAIELYDYCYAGMFQSSSLQEPPAILPVKNPRNVEGCYSYMFDGCKDLQTGPIIMVASTYDFSANGELGQKSVSNISTNPIQTSKSYLSGSDWDRDGHNVDLSNHYNVCSNLFNYMFQNTSIVNSPDIHVCFVNTEHQVGAGWKGMFNNCEQLKSLNIYTHTDNPGHHNYVQLNLFKNMVTPRTESDIIYPKIYCYDGFNKRVDGTYKCADLWLSAMSLNEGGFDSSNIVNLYDLY